MKRTILLSSGLLAAALAIPALAGNYDRSERSMMKAEGIMKKGECIKEDGDMQEGCMMGRHSMTGTVDRIDAAKGTLILKHGAADMLLHFPPAALKDLKNGDTITVYLGFSKGAGK